MSISIELRYVKDASRIGDSPGCPELAPATTSAASARMVFTQSLSASSFWNDMIIGWEMGREEEEGKG